MPLDRDVFETALTTFHRHSRQNDEFVRALLDIDILPASRNSDFAILDLGAGQGYLPSLLRDHAGVLAVLEPNASCVKALRQTFASVYAEAWDEPAFIRIARDHPHGFDLVSMSHMLYHFHGIDDIRAKIRLAMRLVKPSGVLAIVINQIDAPTARVGMSFLRANGFDAEFQTNQHLHAHCHDASFYADAFDGAVAVSIPTLDAPLANVPNRDELIVALRMPLLDPLSDAPCSLDRLDRHIAAFLDAAYPGLTYPATLPSRDDLILIRRKAD